MNPRQLELPIETALSLAFSLESPQDLRLSYLWETFDASIACLTDAQVDCQTQLQVAGEALSQIATLYELQVRQAFDEFSAASHPEGPPMELAEFDRYVRQTMEIDLDQYIEPIPALIELPEEQAFDVLEKLEAGERSLAGAVSKSTLLHLIELLEGLGKQETEAQKLKQIQELSHGEDILLWASRLVAYLQTQLDSSENSEEMRPKVSLLDLPDAVGLSLTEVWLGFLLGEHDYQLCQTGDDFYCAASIKVVLKDGKRKTH